MPGSSKDSLPSLRLELKRSRFETGIVFALMLACLLACWHNALPVWMQWLLTLLVLLFGLAQLLFPSRIQSVRSLRLNRNGFWEMGYPDRDECRLRLLSSTRLLGGCVSLVFQQHNGSKKSVLIFSDSLSDADYAQLRRTIRIHATELLQAKESGSCL